MTKPDFTLFLSESRSKHPASDGDVSVELPNVIKNLVREQREACESVRRLIYEVIRHAQLRTDSSISAKFKRDFEGIQ